MVENITIRLFLIVLSSKISKDSSESTVLQDKLNQANNKVAEFRNQCDRLKKDLKVAHKVRVKHFRLTVSMLLILQKLLNFLTTLLVRVSSINDGKLKIRKSPLICDLDNK